MKTKALSKQSLNKSLITLVLVMISGCASSLPETQIATSSKRIVKPLPSFFRSKPLPLSRADSTRMAGIVLEYFIQASDLQLQEQYDEALKTYQRILHLDTSAMVFYSMGTCYFKLGKTDLAISSMQKALSLDSTLMSAREALAEYYVEHEQYDKALQAYQDLEKYKPNDQTILFILAGLTEYPYPEISETYFKKLVNATGYETEIVKRYGMLLVRLNKENEYIELMRDHHAIHPDNANARSLLIEAFQLYGRVDDALLTIESFLPTSLDEELEEYYQSLLMSILLGNDTQSHAESIERHLKVMEVFPTRSWIATISCAILAEQANLPDFADRFHEKALDLADTSTLQESIGLAYELLRLNEQSLLISHCNRYAKKYPDQSRFPFLLGISAMQKDSLDRAQSYMEEALRRDNNDADAWSELAGIFGNMKKHVSSDSCFRRALQIDSLNASYNNNFAYALSERSEQLNDALRMSLIAVSQYPDNPSYLDTYAWVQFKLGNSQSAIDILQKVLLQGEDQNGTINYHLSIIYRSLANTEKAFDHINKALEIKDNPEYRTLMEQLLKN